MPLCANARGGAWLEHPVSVSSVMERMIYVSDVTMKQTVGLPGESLSFRQKIELAKLLDKLGVSVIETAPIRNGRSDSLLVKSLASAIKDSTLAVPVDIMSAESVQVTWNALRDARHQRLQVCVPVSAVQMEYLCHLKPADILALIGRMVSACAECCPEVEFVAEDSGRSDSEFLGEAVKAAVVSRSVHQLRLYYVYTQPFSCRSDQIKTVLMDITGCDAACIFHHLRHHRRLASGCRAHIEHPAAGSRSKRIYSQHG